MNHTHQAKQPQGSKEYRVLVKKRHSSAKYRPSLNQLQSTTSERFFVKQPQISYKVRAGYLGKLERLENQISIEKKKRKLYPKRHRLSLNECKIKYP